jgi:hypothetical protein
VEARTVRASYSFTYFGLSMALGALVNEEGDKMRLA